MTHETPLMVSRPRSGRSNLERLLLPCDPPLPVAEGGRLPPVPSLWERARTMFARVLSHVGSAAGLARRAQVSRREKKELLGWLAPVESLVRSCLMVKAASFLLMTLEGRRLWRDTQRAAMPDWPEPSLQPSAQPNPPSRPHPNSVSIITIPAPGWHTIAQHRRALALEQQRRRERIDQRRQAAAAIDRDDPSTWSCPFRVIGWTVPDEAGEATDPASGRRTPVPPPPGSGTPRLAMRLARRIEALSRALAEPDRHARTLARYLARLPLEALDGLREAVSRIRSWWKHGFEDARHGAAHVRRAATLLLFRPDHPPEPA